jgi:hypothetical protein
MKAALNVSIGSNSSMDSRTLKDFKVRDIGFMNETRIDFPEHCYRMDHTLASKADF